MELLVSVDSAEVLRGLGMAPARVKYAVVNALNKTIRLGQERVRARARGGRFILRKPDFVLRQVAVIRGRNGGSGFASVRDERFEARMAVGEKPRLLLSSFEEGGERRPFKGKNVAVPLPGGPARPSERASVPEAFTFKALRFTKGPRVAGGSPRARRQRGAPARWRGAQRTFILTRTRNAPHGGVFQRVGPGRSDVRMVYSFSAGVRIPRTLGFVDTARRASAAFQPALVAEIASSIKFAFGRSSAH
jgi:hypothetical protein